MNERRSSTPGYFRRYSVSTAGNDLVMPGKDSDMREIVDAVEGRRLPVLSEEKLDESVVRLIAAALVCDENRL